MSRRLVGGALGAALTFATLTALLTSPAQAVDGDTNGPLLVNSNGSSVLRTLGGDLVATVTTGFASTERGEFSPTGDRIAHVRTECPSDCVSSIVVRSNDGEVEEFGPLASSIESISWSPDGQQLAFSAYETFNDTTIYRMALDGSEPVPLISESESFDIEDHSEISWNPAGSSIVFVGGEYAPEGGYFNAVDASQLYTVPSAGGPFSRFNVHYPEECSYDEAPKTCYYQFEDPEWSPSGGSVVVEVVKHVTTAGDSTDDRFLGTISAGAMEPTKVTEMRELELPGGVRSYRGPSWSPDGTQLLFQDDDGDTLYTATVGVGGGERTRLPESLEWLHDWQPCPGGVCASWGTETERLPTTLTVNVASGDGVVRVNGQVTPNKAGQKVKITLKHLVKGAWVKVAAKSPKLSAKSRYVVKLPKSRKDMCMVVGRYGGDATHKPAARSVTFYC